MLDNGSRSANSLIKDPKYQERIHGLKERYGNHTRSTTQRAYMPKEPVDGDGLGDVIVGALFYDGQSSTQGKAYVVLGSQLDAYPDVALSDAAYPLLGNGTDDYAGASVAGAGDVDGDGLDDVILGGYRGPSWCGVAYLVTGG